MLGLGVVDYNETEIGAELPADYNLIVSEVRNADAQSRLSAYSFKSETRQPGRYLIWLLLAGEVRKRVPLFHGYVSEHASRS